MNPTSFSARLQDLSKEDLLILRERSRSLSRVTTGESGAETIDLLEVACRGQVYAAPLTAVEGVSELSSLAMVPSAPAYVRGLVSFRGEVMLGIDLAAVVGSLQSGFADLRRIICLSAGGKKVALLAERVMTVRSADPKTFVKDPLANSSFVTGIDSSFVSLLNPASFITHAFSRLSGGR